MLLNWVPVLTMLYQGECRRVHCSAGRHFVDGLCPVVFDSALDLGYSLYFSLKAGNDLHLHDEYDLLHVLPGFLEYYLIHSILMTHVRATVRLHWGMHSDKSYS